MAFFSCYYSPTVRIHLSFQHFLLFKTLWKVMSNYHEVMQWHKEHDDFMQTQGDETDGEASYNRKYVTQKLKHGLHRIWKVSFQSISLAEIHEFASEFHIPFFSGSSRKSEMLFVRDGLIVF